MKEKVTPRMSVCGVFPIRNEEGGIIDIIRLTKPFVDDMDAVDLARKVQFPKYPERQQELILKQSQN